MDPFVSATAMCELPHALTAFPVGLNRAGLPLELQVIGPYLEDRTTIRFAALIAESFGGVVRLADYDAG